MTNVDQDVWIERARKLLAHAESARKIGSEAEAEAFMAGLQKLLTAQKLDFSVLTEAQQGEVDPLLHMYHDFDETIGRSRRRQAWVETLARRVARAHFCRAIPVTSSNSILIVGRTSDVQVARYMLDMLVRIGAAGADTAYRKERYHKWKQDKMHEAHGFRSAFLIGYVDRLGERLEAMHSREVASDNRMALIVTRSGLEVQKYVDDNMKLRKGPTPGMNARGREDTLERGIEAGRRAADRVDLNTRGVSGGTSPAERALGRTPRMITQKGEES